MEKTISPFPFTVDRDEEEEIKPHYQVIWHGETLTLMTRFTEKNLLKTMNPYSLQPSTRCRRRREEDRRWGTVGAAAAALGQESRTGSWNGLITKVILPLSLLSYPPE
jgi:hypothetical protein